MNRTRLAVWLLRVGISFAFLYSAIASLFSPFSWIGFMPVPFRSILPGNTMLTIFSIYEIIIGATLLFARTTVISAGLAAFTLFAVVFFNFGALDIVYRDVTILLAALALIALTKTSYD